MREIPIENPPDRPNTFVVVLTGGIASGKTTVSDMFAELGVPVIDTDVIARELVEPGEPALQRIAQELGPEFLDSSGRLDRAHMRQAIFADADLKSCLESILHPLIAQEAQQRLQDVSAPYVLLVIPLYRNSNRWPYVDYVIVVDANEETQVRRVMSRDNVDRAHALAILAAQASRNERLALADHIIENNGDLATLQDRVKQVHNQVITIARHSL